MHHKFHNFFSTKMVDCIFAYTKNWLVSLSDNKELSELSSGADAIGWNSLSQKKKKKKIVDCNWHRIKVMLKWCCINHIMPTQHVNYDVV